MTTAMNFPESQMSLADINALLEAGRIERVDESTMGNYVVVFSLPETSKRRRRWIAHPVEQNCEVHIKVPMCDMRAIEAGVQEEGAVLLDIAAYYQQMELPEESRKHYIFRCQHGCYRLTTVPTGHTHCTGVAQTLSRALALQTGGKVAIYNDNFRCAGPREQALRDAYAIHDQATALGIQFNEQREDLLFLTCYDFLGVRCNHDTKTVSLTQRALEKLAHIDNVLQSKYEFLTMRDVDSIIGFLVFASTVLGFKLGLVYHIFKFHRRRSRAKLSDHDGARPWPGIRQQWLRWVKSLRSNSPRSIIPRIRKRTHTLFTDASLSGWGAYLITDDGEVRIIADSWQQGVTRHINILEIWAVRNALTKFADTLKGCKVQLFIDNTTALTAVEKQRSRCFILNQVALDIQDIAVQFDLDITVEYVPSADNLADAPSRMLTSS